MHSLGLQRAAASVILRFARASVAVGLLLMLSCRAVRLCHAGGDALFWSASGRSAAGRAAEPSGFAAIPYLRHRFFSDALNMQHQVQALFGA